MAAYLTNAIQEVQNLLASTWTDVVGDNGGKRVYEVEHVSVIPFDTLTLPYAVLVVESQPWQDGPLARNYVQLDCQAFYIAENAGLPTAIRTKVEALRDALYPTSTLALSQVWDEPLPHAEWSMRLEINRLLRAKKMAALAGRVTFRLIAGQD